MQCLLGRYSIATTGHKHTPMAALEADLLQVAVMSRALQHGRCHPGSFCFPVEPKHWQSELTNTGGHGPKF